MIQKKIGELSDAAADFDNVRVFDHLDDLNDLRPDVEVEAIPVMSQIAALGTSALVHFIVKITIFSIVVCPRFLSFDLERDG